MEKVDGIGEQIETTPLYTNRSGASRGGASVSPGSTVIGSWFEAMARAWGSTLDEQATEINRLSKGIGEGLDSPSQVTLLSGQSMRMQFMAESASTSMKSVAQALESLARKQ